ncbi:MAG: hypothetical protein DI563_25160 [Variovorax paradoxus]|uniref:Uncharacterized protein n=1 Tax=Variovorax paradoxus TaxID=34073 RepID=A0A2W5PK90_VARPD|nr:MAG: hypothetical protein DI563_25160 [Variovorax paradoxus]
MAPPRSPAARGPLPPEVALAALGRPGGGDTTPTLPRCARSVQLRPTSRRSPSHCCAQNPRP